MKLSDGRQGSLTIYAVREREENPKKNKKHAEKKQKKKMCKNTT